LRRSFYNDIKRYSILDIVNSINNIFDDEISENQSKELVDIIKGITEPLI